MKKSLLALAVLGAFAGAASAQSSVTVYGLVEVQAQKAIGTADKAIADTLGAAGFPVATRPVKIYPV